jgi:hypothetical protein
MRVTADTVVRALAGDDGALPTEESD